MELFYKITCRAATHSVYMLLTLLTLFAYLMDHMTHHDLLAHTLQNPKSRLMISLNKYRLKQDYILNFIFISYQRSKVCLYM